MINDFNLFALGDSAITIDLGNLVDEALNEKVLAMQQWLGEHLFEGFTDSIVAYSSLSVFYDPVVVLRRYPAGRGAFEFVKERLQEAWRHSTVQSAGNEEPVRIPVCYEGNLGPDLAALAGEKDMSPEEIVRLHVSRVYRVYMIGFLPGFAYLGETDKQLAVARKPRPVPVGAGSVGITGRQTGIYPLNSPGGWHIIGRTPVVLFDPAAEVPVRLKIGDRVAFYPISREEFGQLSVL
jgi:inhibitor of KinA